MDSTIRTSPDPRGNRWLCPHGVEYSGTREFCEGAQTAHGIDTCGVLGTVGNPIEVVDKQDDDKPTIELAKGLGPGWRRPTTWRVGWGWGAIGFYPQEGLIGQAPSRKEAIIAARKAWSDYQESYEYIPVEPE